MSVWQTQEWRDRSVEFVKGKVCEWCGSAEKLVPHHPRRKQGYTREQYLNLEDCIPLCQKCNFMESKGYKLCPVCKKHYYKKKRGRDEMCWDCFSQTSLGQSVKTYYEKHPEELKRKRKRLRK